MAVPTRAHLLVVDDEADVRQALLDLLTSMDYSVRTASDGAQALHLLRAERPLPDVILLDLMMPRLDGIAAIGEIKREQPDARILVLTSFAEDEKVFAAIKGGALGYLLKDSSPQEFLQAIREVARGESSLHPTIARKVLRELSRPPELPATPEPLTARELDVLRLVAQGLANQEIAGRLALSERTVRTHVSQILTKLHLANRTQAALYALREGLACPHSP